MSREPASILDVARAAGVSGMTVSRVLNGQPNVRAATRARVLAAMEELRFRPSRAARALSTKRSRTIGLLVAAGAQYGPASCVSAVEEAARERGYYTTVARLGPDSPDALAAAAGDLLDQDVEGIVVVAPRAGLMSGLAPLAGGVPLMAARSGDDHGAQMMMKYLIGQGHRRILHVAGPPDWDDAHARRNAYESELRLAGLPVLPPVFGDWTAESGYTAGHLLLWGSQGPQAGPGFTAAFCANDQMALGLIHALHEAGVDVPADVSVAGFDDIPEAAHFWPPLTTVRQDFGEAGRNCVALLIEAIGEAGNPNAAVPAPGGADPRLMIRNSVAAVSPAPAADARRPDTAPAWAQATPRQMTTDVA
jgi:DNA-binding LacI/PurR family transcriptional regulator